MLPRPVLSGRLRPVPPGRAGWRLPGRCRLEAVRGHHTPRRQRCSSWGFRRCCLLDWGSLYSSALVRFDQEWVLDFVKCFFCIYWDYRYEECLFWFIDTVNYIDWFWMPTTLSFLEHISPRQGILPFFIYLPICLSVSSRPDFGLGFHLGAQESPTELGRRPGVFCFYDIVEVWLGKILFIIFAFIFIRDVGLWFFVFFWVLFLYAFCLVLVSQ